MDWVVQIGLVELALGGLLGWAMVIRAEKSEWLARIGVPLAFDPDVEKRLWYRLLAVVSFIGVSGGLVAAAIVGPA
jgi:hypothetical protein